MAVLLHVVYNESSVQKPARTPTVALSGAGVNESTQNVVNLVVYM